MLRDQTPHVSVVECNHLCIIVQQDEPREFPLPEDVLRVATPRTLRVFHGGISKRWKLVKNGIMMLVGPWFRFACESSRLPFRH